jgi:hypothetical protein
MYRSAAGVTSYNLVLNAIPEAIADASLRISLSSLAERIKRSFSCASCSIYMADWGHGFVHDLTKNVGTEPTFLDMAGYITNVLLTGVSASSTSLPFDVTDDVLAVPIRASNYDIIGVVYVT